MFSFLKNKTSKGLVGLEVRPDGLAMAVAKREPGSDATMVTDCGFRACNAAERKDVLSTLVKEFGLQAYPCNLVLPADQYQTYPIEKPKVDDSELADAARWKIKDMLDYDIEHAVTDVYDFPADALRGRPAQLNVIASRHAIIKGYVDLVNDSELELESIDVADLALRNVAVRSAEEERPVAILYLRQGSGMMALVKNGLLYLARHFDFSLNALNDPGQQESVIQNLGLEVQRSFDYFESQMGQVPPQTLTLIGPDPSIPLGNMMGSAIAARVQSFDWAQITGEDKKDIEAIQCLVAAGAALRSEQADEVSA